MEVGRSLTRVDAFDKVTGRAKYTDDLHGEAILVARILHSTIANGVVRSMDISEAQAVPGVVKVLTCFDVPDIQYPTPGHPWSVEEAHQDVADRKLLATRVRIYGDDIAVVVAENELAAQRGPSGWSMRSTPFAPRRNRRWRRGPFPSTRSTRTMS